MGQGEGPVQESGPPPLAPIFPVPSNTSRSNRSSSSAKIVKKGKKSGAKKKTSSKKTSDVSSKKSGCPPPPRSPVRCADQTKGVSRQDFPVRSSATSTDIDLDQSGGLP